MTHDPINHPSHYTFGKIEVIDVIEDWRLGFHAGNVVKYVARSGKKHGSDELDDLRKARWYLDRLIAGIEKRRQEQRSMCMDCGAVVEDSTKAKDEHDTVCQGRNPI